MISNKALPLLLGSVILVLGAACSCSPLQQGPTTPTQTIEFETTLAQATEFEDGTSAVPVGYRLLVELAGHTSGQGNCEEMFMYIDFPEYEFTGGRLWGLLYGETTNRSRVLVAYRWTMAGTAGTGESSHVEAVDTLPYELYPGIVLHAVNQQGAAAVDVHGDLVWIEPGQQWERRTRTHHARDCIIAETDTLANRGLLRDDQIDLVSEIGDFP
jgi:hypothetical protein